MKSIKNAQSIQGGIGFDAGDLAGAGATPGPPLPRP